MHVLVVWQREIAFTVTVVNTGSEIVLFDSGNGGDTARQSMYLLLQSHQRLANCESVINIGNRYANRFRSSAQAPEALYSVAQCQTRLQQRDIARDTWRRLIQIYPDSAAAKRAYRQMNPR